MLFNFAAPLFDFRTTASFDREKERAQRQKDRRFVEDSLEVRLARLCMAGKLNGFTDYQLAVLVMPKLKAEVGMKSLESSELWILPGKKKKLLSVILFVLFLIAVLGSLFILCTPCQRYSRMLGRRVLFKVRSFKEMSCFNSFVLAWALLGLAGSLLQSLLSAQRLWAFLGHS